MKGIKKAVSLFLVLWCVCPAMRASAVSVSAECAILVSADTGEILYSQKGTERHSMASTTKIMTALLALESGAPERMIQVTKDMVAVEGTSMGLLPGDTVSLYGLACGMLLSSGNDAANATAIALSGSQEAFAKRMNTRAAQIGMKNTHFVTPSGLDDAEHYSTAYDMALLGCAAIQNPVFLRICSSESIAVSYGNPPYVRVLTNHNRLLQMYEPCIGIKTGFTKKSGRCLVSAARQDGVTLVAVTLNAPDDWNDHIAMYRYGFNMMHCYSLDGALSENSMSVIGGVEDSVPITLAQAPCMVSRARVADIERIAYRYHFVYAPVRNGDVVGRVVYKSGDRVVCTTDLIASDSVDAIPVEPVQNTEQRKPLSRIRDIWSKIKGVL